jgi:hypothetical protein
MSYADLTQLAADFWTWRARTQPASGDDIPRIERPVGWLPDWSADAAAGYRQQLAQFGSRWQALEFEAGRWPVAQQVDFRLIGSALSRVRWELDVLRSWQRNPRFYVLQTLGLVFEALLQPPPFDAVRVDAVRTRLERIPDTLTAARENLAGHAIRPFAIASLDDIGTRLGHVLDGLGQVVDVASMRAATQRASIALEDFSAWLSANLASMPTETAIGRQAYVNFLNQVALVPLSPEQIAAAGQQEFERSVAFEALEQHRNRALPDLEIPATQDEWIEREAAGEAMLRQFCEDHDLLTFPGWLKHYKNLPLPSYLAPLRRLGVTDDLTGPSRLSDDGISYIPPPSPELPYFYLAMARDPRTLIAHEGIHYYQLALSWAHENPIRRRYYDSGPNEGIGFYSEEMFLQAGLFDDSPRSREIIYNFMRLRALRVAVDVRLALGELTIDTAAEELARRVPMDVETARDEAAMFASEPGQAITYQIGKLQILKLLSAARSRPGFSLRTFHDNLLLNGNVPIALQEWELS